MPPWDRRKRLYIFGKKRNYYTEKKALVPNTNPRRLVGRQADLNEFDAVNCLQTRRKEFFFAVLSLRLFFCRVALFLRLRCAFFCLEA